MMTNAELQTRLKKRKNALLGSLWNSPAGHAKRDDVRRRVRYLSDRIDDLAIAASIRRISVFVSYSIDAHDKCLLVERIAREEFSFEVITGFQELPGGRSNTLGEVKRRIASATGFLGIMTPDFQMPIDMNSGGDRWCPSIWVAEEKGMALGMEKPFHLLVDERVHQNFFLKTSPEQIHSRFNDESFELMARRALERLEQKFNDYLLS